MPTLHARLRAARVGLGMRQTDLAAEAAVSLSSLSRLEGGGDVHLSVLLACQAAVVARGVELLEGKDRLGLYLPPLGALAEGARLNAIRDALGIGQLELASVSGVNDKSLRGIEKGAPMSQNQRYGLSTVLRGLGIDLLEDGDRLGVLFPTPAELERRLENLRFGPPETV